MTLADYIDDCEAGLHMALSKRRKKKMKININDEVTVKLTDFGEQLLAEKGVEKASLCGEYKFQLWELMQIFGDCMYNGMPKMPFVKNELIIGE